jgi:dethiobiotin synthetase
MSTLFVTATNTGVGKSFASKVILEAIATNYPKIAVGVCKPIETGVSKEPLDASLLLNSCKAYNSNFLSLTPQDITAYTFALPAAPFVADEKSRLSLPKIKAKIKELESLCDILIIEGAGGLMVPIKKDYFMIDLIKEVADFTLLVTPSKLGAINDTLLSILALKSKEIEFDWCINLYEDKGSFSKVTEPFYKDYFGDYWILQNDVNSFIKKVVPIYTND